MTETSPATPDLSSHSRVDAPEALGERFARAVDTRDLDAIVALYAADAVVSLAGGREAAGTAAIRGAYARALAEGTDLRTEGVGEAIVEGDHACTTTRGPGGEVRTQVARLDADRGWLWVRDARHLRSLAALAPARQEDWPRVTAG